LGLTKVRLLTNHPRKIVGLEAYGIEIVDQQPVELLTNTQTGAFSS